ncbi:MAG: amidase [Streptococcus pyogenes]|nr:MAG: amidase [Streptococcus pyogenes]
MTLTDFNDATAMALAIQAKHISPKELVTWTIEQALAMNPKINAIVDQRYEAALAEAQSRSFKGLPFAGVPIFLKDLGQDKVGLRATSGAKLLQKHYPRQDTAYVQRLEALGFIILGTSNTPEYGFKNISDSRANGAVNLPMDVSRNAGGSSGGAAALVSSGVTSLSPASDGGGSIRIPASFNGLIGLKPSRGRTPVGPTVFRSWQGAAVHFAVTKTVRDTKRLLYYLQTLQMESPFPLPLLSEQTVFASPQKKWRIALFRKQPDGQPLRQEANQALLNASRFLASQGHQIEEINQLPIDMAQMTRSYYIMNGAETANMFRQLAEAMGRALTKDDMEIMTWAIYQSGRRVLAQDYARLLYEWDDYSAQLHAFFQDYDVLLLPSTHDIAPKHGQLDPSPDLLVRLAHAAEYSNKEQLELVEQMFEKGLALNPNMSIANLTGATAISLPTHMTTAGLPLGIQFLAAKGQEGRLLELAQQFEEAGQFRQVLTR